MSDREFHPLGNEQHKTCPHAWVRFIDNRVTCVVCGAEAVIRVADKSTNSESVDTSR